MNEALDELFTRLGFDRRALWRISVFFWVLYVGSCILAVYLSAWGMKKAILVELYLYLTLVALPLLFSPALWQVGGGILVIAGQFGGERGISLKDAMTALKEYGTPLLNKAGYVLLLALPIWFFAMLLIDTRGIELWFVFGLPLLPTVIYLCVRRWPNGETFEAAVRTTLLVVVLGILGWGIINTLQRGVTDPAVQEVQEYHATIEEQRLEDERKLAKLLRSKLEAGTKLTTQEQQAWDILNRKEQTQSITAQATQFVAGAKVTDGGWWQNHWLAVVGTIALAFIGYRLLKRKSAPAGVATTTAPAAPAAGKGTPGMFSMSWWWEILIVGILSVVATIYWLTGPGYYDKASLTMRDRNAGEICGLSSFPKNQRFMFVALGRKRGEIPVRITDGTRMSDSDLASSLMVEGAKQMKPFLPPQGEHCLRYQHAIESGHDYKFASTMTLNLMFVPYYENTFMKWVIGWYY